MQNNFKLIIRSLGLKSIYFSSSLSMSRTYEASVKALNTLQSNAAVLKESCKSGEIKQSDRFEKAKCFAARAKVQVEELDRLSAIHVSGTKGKGSVCAFTDSILRESGYKTGFFSSPHLVEVRERIRINGKIISKEMFAKYFWECWDNLKQGSCSDMPPYFAFLTVMSFYVFLQEKVDVSIVEVGIGGAYDTTNIIRKPWVCGVTSLGHDHLSVLGGTTESIAWNKAGIFKCGVPAFTVLQDKISTQVLSQRAQELKAPLKIVPDMHSYPGEPITTLGIEGKHQFENASLAVQLCKSWLERRKKEDIFKQCLNSGQREDNNIVTPSNIKLIPLAEAFPINTMFKSGLQKTYWPGRMHFIKRDRYTLYLDGAHTPKSCEACATWLRERADHEKKILKPQSTTRVLIFNCTGERDQRKLLAPLAECNFDYAVFCTNSITEELTKNSTDLSDFTSSMKTRHCHDNHETWKTMTGETNSHLSLLTINLNKTLKLSQNIVQSSCIFTSVTDALHWIIGNREPSIYTRHPDHPPLPRVISRADHVQIVVTGSLHLVGAAMKVLGREITGEI